MDLPHFDQQPEGICLFETVLFPELNNLETVCLWLDRIFHQELRRVQSVSYVFVGDEALLKINQDYLQHDTLTDIITFPYSDDPIAGEIYISADRVRENAEKFGVPVLTEVLRVMAHGALHLCGWTDASRNERALMQKRENACLELYGIFSPGSVTSPS